MERTSQRPHTTRRWRPSAPPRSPSWSRFCVGPLTPKWPTLPLTPKSQTSAPRRTSPSSTSWPSPICPPLHPQSQSWRSICFQRSKYQLGFFFFYSRSSTLQVSEHRTAQEQLEADYFKSSQRTLVLNIEKAVYSVNYVWDTHLNIK